MVSEQLAAAWLMLPQPTETRAKLISFVLWGHWHLADVRLSIIDQTKGKW